MTHHIAAILFAVLFSVATIAQEPAGVEYSIPMKDQPLVLVEGQRVAAEAIEQRYVLVQFRRTLRQTERQSLAALGLVPLTHYYDGAWICALEVAPDEVLINAYDIVALRAWEPAFKAEPRLRRGEVEPWALSDIGDLRLLVRTHEDVDRVTARALLAPHVRTLALHDGELWAVELPFDRLFDLLAVPAVFQVSEGPIPFQPVNDEGLALIRADEVQDIDTGVVPPAYNGRSGEGVFLAVSEGVNTSHPDFFDHDAAGLPTTSRFTNPGGGTSDWHGTLVAGIIGGNGWNSVLNWGTPYEWRGVAPEATLIRSSYIGGSAYGPSTRVDASNHSYVQNWGYYGSSSQTADRQIRGGYAAYYRRPHAWAVANQGDTPQYDNEEGYYSIYAPCKNAIGVGALNANDGSLAKFSSLGPTFDGRIKPDVMAAGFKTYLPPDKNPADSIRMWIDYVRILDGTTVDYAWEFNTPNDTEGWFDSETLEISNLQVVAGNMSFEVPYVLNSFGFADLVPDLVAKSTHVIEMRYAYDDPYATPWSVAPKFFWRLDGGDYVDGQITFNTTADGNYHTVTVPVGLLGLELDSGFGEIGLGGWTGIIDKLRLDPMDVYDGLQSTAAFGETYKRFTGTSAAAPFVTGTVGLMLEEYADSHGVDIENAPPLPSTIKAILVQTAIDLVHSVADTSDPDNPDTFSPVLYYEGPDFATGYGVVDAVAAVELIASSATSPRMFEGELDVGELDEYTIAVPLGQEELRVTLAWDDYEGTVGLDERVSRLVNDLDLTLIAPNAVTHYPWRLDPLPVADCGGSGPGCGDLDPILPGAVVAASRGPDARNNVEQAVVDFPLSGTWTVRVNDGDIDVPVQDYSVVANLSMISLSPWIDLGGGTLGSAGQPTLVGSGILVSGAPASVTLTNAPASAAMLAWVSFAPVPFAALGGTVHAHPFSSQLLLFANGSGSFTASTAWPMGIPVGTEVTFQFLVEDLSTIHAITLSNGVMGTAQ